MKSTSDQKAPPVQRFNRNKDRFVRGEDYEELGADTIRTDLPVGVFRNLRHQVLSSSNQAT
jgi:hypothetical protein